MVEPHLTVVLKPGDASRAVKKHIYMRLPMHNTYWRSALGITTESYVIRHHVRHTQDSKRRIRDTGIRVALECAVPDGGYRILSIKGGA